MRARDNRWTKQATLWSCPGKGVTMRGRPKARWSDDIIKVAGKSWWKTAIDREKWRRPIPNRGHDCFF
ncbi:hypothetical protein RR48_09275 [Papilio machaon]|uniref:Uncharacterized protein n=1 Tax=Papilio machaon TaxID=76193 RepID=A0A194RBN5_PAPMA|nr:hypothetical protein RR48_09275 [Papilio machaon]